MALRLSPLLLLCVALGGCVGEDAPASAAKGGLELVYRPHGLTAEQKQNLQELRGKVKDILDKRVDSLGVTEALVTLEGEDGIKVVLPGYKDLNEARRRLMARAEIAFYEAGNVAYLDGTRAARRVYEVANTAANPDEPGVVFMDKTGMEIQPTLAAGSPNPKYLKIIEGWGEPIVTGKHIERASFTTMHGARVPMIFFNRVGAERFRRWSTRMRNKRENIALAVDDVVINLASLQDNTVIRDQAMIDGEFSEQYVKNLIDLLNQGALPCQLEEVSNRLY